MGHTEKMIADTISKELNLPQRTGRKFLQKVIEMISDDIVYTGSSKLRGLGSFAVKVRAATTTTHPTTGNPVHIPEKKVLHFKTSLQIRRRLNPSKPGKRKTAKKRKPSV